MLCHEHVVLGCTVTTSVLMPLIFGLILLSMGAVSFFARARLSAFGARASAALSSSEDSYERAYSRRLRYGVVSGFIFMLVGAGFLVAALVGLFLQ